MKRKSFLGLVALAVVLLSSLNSCTTIDSGSVGIKFHKWAANEDQQGGVLGTCKGWVWYNPFTQDIYEYETYVQRKGYDNIKVNTKDAAIFNISPFLAYRLDESKATDIFVKYRQPLSSIEEGYIKTCIYEAYRTVGNTYTSDELMANRETFEQKIRERLEKSLLQEGFHVLEFTSNITPPESLSKAIDAKNAAIQDALRAENEVKKAEANAKIAIAKAEGESKALRVQADGEAYYNRTVSASLSGLLLDQYRIEKWNGVYPTTLAGQGSNLLLNIK